MDETGTSSANDSSSLSSTGDIASALTSAYESAKGAPATPAAPPQPPSSAGTSAAKTASPAVAPGSIDPRTPPTAATTDPDVDLSTPPVGPIPPDRHKKILDATRTKVAAETKAAFEKELGPWNALRAQFTPDEFAGLVPTLQNLAKAPHRFLADMAKDLGYQLVPAGSSTPPSPQRGPASTEEPPPPDIHLDDGRALYSATQQAKRDQWFLAQIRSEREREMQPFREQQQRADQAQAQQEFFAKIDTRARAEFADVSTCEAFEELRPHIARIMQADKRYSLQGAYLRAYKEQYLPTRDTKIRQAVVDELQHKGRAATSSLTPHRQAGGKFAPANGASTVDLLKEAAAAAGVSF